MSLAGNALRRQRTIVDTVELLTRQALGPLLPTLQVLRSRDHPGDIRDHLVNLYFLAGDVDQGFGTQEDDARFVVRIATRNGVKRAGAALPVDDELRSVGADLLDVLAADEDLGGIVGKFVLSHWEYGEPKGSTYTYLALIFAVEFVTEE